MALCNYFYKGHKFDSEILLDDFLMSNWKFMPKLGDIAFSTSQNIVASLIADIRRKNKELREKADEWRHSAEYDAYGDPIYEHPPYIGVNRFLGGLKVNGQLLFPEFRREVYRKQKLSEWRDGIFTDEEEKIFEITSGTKVTDLVKLDKWWDLLLDKWKTQAKIGTAIHSVLQIYFSKKSGDYVFKMPGSALKNYISSKISDENMKYLTPETIEQTIEYAKKLKQDIVDKLAGTDGEESLMFYPELAISLKAQDPETDNEINLFGIIDLLVVDKNGKSHILDYKTSIHNYLDFSTAKELTYRYLLATYNRMLAVSGLNMSEGRMMVAPIQIKDFEYHEDGTYNYAGINYETPIHFIDTSLTLNKIWERIDEFMPEPISINVEPEKLEEEVDSIMKEWFPRYSSSKLVTEKLIIEELKKRSKNGKIEPDENGVFKYKSFGTKEEITATSETEFIKKVVLYRLSQLSSRQRTTKNIKKILQQGINEETPYIDFPSGGLTENGGSPTWVLDTLKKYCSKSWKIIDNATLESYGVIMLQNTRNGQVDFVRISNKTLDYNYREGLSKDDPEVKAFRNRTGLTGTYEEDIKQKSKASSLIKIGGELLNVLGNLMAEALNGNVEIMETMLIINNLANSRGMTVGNIQIVNPWQANGMLLSNELAYYCFSELNKHKAVENNKFASGEIKLASKYEIVSGMLTDIMESGEEYNWKDDYGNFRNFATSKSMIDRFAEGSTEDKIQALLKLLTDLTKENNHMKESLSTTYSTLFELQLKHVALYNAVLIAIMQLKGINFKLQIKDHDKWLESIFIWKHGISGSYLNNPGNLDSETLNLCTKLVTEAYLNTRDYMLSRRLEVKELVDAVKREKGFGSLKESTFGNQAALYSDLYRTTPEGDILFKRPEDVASPASRKLLEYALDEINAKRFANKSPEDIEKMKKSGDDRYYRVPLAKGGSDTTVSVSGMMTMLKEKLRSFNPKVAFRRAREKVEGIFNADEDVKSQQLTMLLYQMTNQFDRGEEDPEKRITEIKTKGEFYFERNLETLLLKHIFAYSVKENVDAVFPMIKASMIHLTMEGAERNKKFTSDIQYLDEYIRNKILNQSIIDPKRQEANKYLAALKSAASKFTLAFAPVQMIYQPLQGFWQDISLMIRQPNGKESFTFSNFSKAIKLVYGDLFKSVNSPTVCSELNKLYGINDMDMNTYVDRISTAKRGIWNFENLLFKFATRPDYYNRMSIFTALMIGDGCLKAHKINSKGELVYNWKEDDRFSAFAKGDKSDINKYNKQKALYYAVAKQFEIERAKVKINGKFEDFKVNMDEPMALPRAYTNKEAESMKSLGDDIYGYYSHEKKSMIMSTMIGSMWLQFKTYWSGKKNLYLNPAGVRLRGNWKHYEENGLKYYYQVDEKGNILYDKSPTTEETIAPVMLWEGQWLEGILLTLANFLKSPRTFKETIKSMDKNDPLRLALVSNLKQLGYDILLWVLIGSVLGGILGSWLKKEKEENRQNKDIITGALLAAANVVVSSVKNSAMDFNFIESIGSPIGSWTPFSFEWVTRFTKNILKMATGEEDFQDTVVKTFSGLNLVKPLLDSVKPTMFRTKREGGTFGL